MAHDPIFLEGVITEYHFPNRGIMKTPVEQSAGVAVSAEKDTPSEPETNTKQIQVKNALPGQTVRVQVGKSGKHRRTGRMIEVLRPAPYETAPRCPHAGSCGGCLYQTVPYDVQLQIKDRQVHELLEPVIPDFHPEWPAIIPSPLEEGYRNKMEFSFGDEIKGGPLCLGLHKRGAFHDIVTTDGCRIIHADFRQILQATLTYFRDSGTSYLNKTTHLGYLRHLVLRRSFTTGDILVNLITTSQEDHDLSSWTESLLQLPLEGQISGILHTTNDSLADAVKNEHVEILWGRDELTESLLGLSFKIFPFSFFQTNSKGAERLYSIVRDFCGDITGKTIFDLYCGTGTIAQILAAGKRETDHAHVTGIEIVEEAVKAARLNATSNGLSNCGFLCGDVLKLIDTLEENPDIIVLDPPREGIHPKALPKIIDFRPEHLIYISCNPAALARDLPAFIENGYEIKKLQSVDMFPGTVHVETVVLMSIKNRKPDIHINVSLDMDDDDRIKKENSEKIVKQDQE